MSGDVFRVRFDGREWWAMGTGQGDAIYLTDPARVSDNPPSTSSVSYCSSYEVPAHLVKRVDDIPPEPTVGAVLWDKDDVPWMWRDSAPPAWWNAKHGWWAHDTLVRERGPLHPYPRAARDEIERLTVHLKAKDAHAVEMAAQIKRLRAERDAAQSAHGQACAAVAELQRRIDRALDYLGDVKPFSGRVVGAILRGEVGQ